MSVRHFLKHFEDIFNFGTIGCCVHHTCTLDDYWSIGIEYSLAEMKNIRISLLVFANSATVYGDKSVHTGPKQKYHSADMVK